MSFQFSHQFHRHWLAAPAMTRRQIKEDLAGIIELLNPDTPLLAWQKKYGIHHTDTTKAEQVGLFDVPEEATTQRQDSVVSNSNFLKQVTQTNEKVQAPEKKQTQPVFEAVSFSQKSQIPIDNKFMAEIETKIDEYLQEQCLQIKSDVMQWLQHELENKAK